MATFTRDEIVSKIQKLLRLAESSNVNEAAAAAAKAQELMDRFEIESAALQSDAGAPQPDEPVETFDDFDRSGRLETWKGILIACLAKTNGCMCYKTREGRTSVIKVIGRKQDAQTVRYLYGAMVELVEGLAAAQKGNGRSFIASFKLGAASAITKRIKESKETTKQAIYQEAAQQGGQALMRVDNAVASLKARDAALASYMARQNLNLRGGGRTTYRSGDGFNQGYQAGMNANMGGGARRLGAGSAQLPG